MNNHLEYTKEEKTPFTKATKTDTNKLQTCKIYKNKMLTIQEFQRRLEQIKKHNMFLDRRTYHHNDLIFVMLLYSFNMIPVK